MSWIFPLEKNPNTSWKCQAYMVEESKKPLLNSRHKQARSKFVQKNNWFGKLHCIDIIITAKKYDRILKKTKKKHFAFSQKIGRKIFKNDNNPKY